MKVLVIGGTLFIGKPLVRRLQEAGHEVWVLHRRSEHDLGPEVGNLTADRNDPEAVVPLLRRHRFDAVFDNVYDWERGTTADQVLACARAVGGVRRYVFMSSVAAYGEGLDRREEDELAPADHPNAYVRHKAESERGLLEYHQHQGFPAVTLRPPYIYGPGNAFYREAFFWDRMRDDRPIMLPNGGDRLMQFVYVHDLVDACLKCLDTPEAVGEAFNVAHPDPITQAQWVRLLGEAASTQVRMIDIPRSTILEAGGDLLGRNLYFGTYYDNPPITMRVDKARRLLGFEPSDMRQALRETYRWYRNDYQGPPPDYDFENTLFARLGIPVPR